MATGHSPKGNWWECWDPSLGPSVVRPPVIPLPTMWPTQSLTVDFLHMAGWLANCSWLAGWLAISKCQPDPPLADIWWPSVLLLGSGWPVLRCTPCRNILWLSVILLHLWFRFTFGQMYPPQPETSCGQVWYCFRSCWPVYLRVSLVPAAMVTPAPLAYIKIVAVKKVIFICWDD